MAIELVLVERSPNGNPTGRKISKVCNSGAEVAHFWSSNQATFKKKRRVKKKNNKKEFLPKEKEAINILKTINKEQEKKRAKIDGE